MARCEWDPEKNDFAESEYGGCLKQAVWSIGQNGHAHLCEVCAELPRFKRFSVRKPLRKNEQERVSTGDEGCRVSSLDEN